MSLDQDPSEQEIVARNIEARENARLLERAIDFGFQVQAFLDGPIGQRLLHDAATEREELVAMLIALDPDNESERERIRKVRFEIKVIDHWQTWLGRYTREGANAAVQYQEEGVISGEA